MSFIKWFEKFYFIENIFGIYKNFCRFKKVKKCFIILHIFVQNTLQFIVVLSEFYLLFNSDSRREFYIVGLYSLVAYINTLAFVLNSIWYSEGFIAFHSSISRLSNHFMSDTTWLKSVKKLFWFILPFALFVLVFSVYRGVDSIKYFPKSTSTLILGSILGTLTVIRIIIILENFLYFVNIMLVFSLSKSLTLLVTTAKKTVGMNAVINVGEERDVTRYKIEEWVALYRELTSCCENLSITYGQQFVFSLTMTLTHYILMMYHTVCLHMVQGATSSVFYSLARMILIASVYVLVMIMSLFAGQKLQNQGMKFQQKLASLYNIMIVDSSQLENKLVKDFIRLIKKNPLRIKLLSKASAGMYMLPFMIMLAINYFIVLLQFNHVI